MSVFTGNELNYLQKQRLGRPATVDTDGNPHIVPVGVHYIAWQIDGQKRQSRTIVKNNLYS